MRSPHIRSLVRLAIVIVTAALALVASPAAAQAPPDAARPYLELPFPRGSDYPVTCGYGCYQHHGSMHYAVDFDVPAGDPIVAAAPGEVMAVTWELGLPASLDLGDALIVYVDHGGGWFTRYVHLDGVTVRVGDHVEMGDVIGYSGKTGASGDHLHFELKYGTSLHSPAVPIDELFDATPPEAGDRYVSNNRDLLENEARPVVDAGPAPTASPTSPNPSLGAPTPTAAPAEAFDSRFPQVETALTLSTEAVSVGEPVTATFTLRNESRERLHLKMLGVAGRAPGDVRPLDDTLFFDRSLVLNPGRRYEFRQTHHFSEAGDYELFIFALGPDNEWLPLGGEGQTALLRVTALQPSLFLPLVGTSPTVSPSDIAK